MAFCQSLHCRIRNQCKDSHQAAVRTLPEPCGERNDTAASPDGPINKAPEETLLNKSNPCQSFLELRRNTASYGNTLLSTSETYSGATGMTIFRSIRWTLSPANIKRMSRLFKCLQALQGITCMIHYIYIC